MIDTFDYNGIPVPFDVNPADEINAEWVLPLAQQEMQETTCPADVWKKLFDVIFADERFTEKHKYAMCLLISADMLKMIFDMKYGDVLRAYEEAIKESEEELIMAPKLILP